MKTVKFFSLALLALVMNSFVFAGNPNEPAVKFTVKSYTVKELKTMYGDRLVLGDLKLADDQVVNQFTMANPCADFPDFDLCGPVAAQAGQAARELANQCCCDILYSWECCDPSSGPVEYIALASPRPHCN